MTTSTRSQKSYDHRLKDLVFEAGDIKLAVERGVPRSTAWGWLHSSREKVITIDVLEAERKELEQEVLKLRQRIEKILAILRIFIVLLKVSDFSLTNCRVPDSAKKAKLLKAIEQSLKSLPFRCVLRILKISPTRYFTWKRSLDECELDDQSSCPKFSPHQITLEEKQTIRDMVTSSEYRHVPTGTLAMLAQRLGKVYTSASTWYRLVREHGWRRPRQRIYPLKAKVGIRTSKPDEVWHIDTTVIKLLDGTRTYLHAVIDNFSRRILAWNFSERFGAESTVSILLEASSHLVPTDESPTVLVDGGVENYNHKIDELVNSGLLRRILAQTEISFSNSMIESWWRSLKHQWLYLNTLDSIATVRRLISFYVTEHNTRLPHSAFNGQTPEEMYLGKGDHIPKDLEKAKAEARQERMKSNRSLSCKACEKINS